jgi:hypothetical protein
VFACGRGTLHRAGRSFFLNSHAKNKAFLFTVCSSDN